MIQELQIEIVKAIVNSVSQQWDRITFNIEAGDVAGSETLSEDGDAWLNGESDQIFLDYATELLLRQLRKEMAAGDPDSRCWSVCDIEVTSDGRYSYDFSYDAPKRITELNAK